MVVFPLSVDSLDECLHPGSAFTLHFFGDMAVYIQGKSCGEVAQHAADCLDIHTSLEGDGGEGHGI